MRAQEPEHSHGSEATALRVSSLGQTRPGRAAWPDGPHRRRAGWQVWWPPYHRPLLPCRSPRRRDEPWSRSTSRELQGGSGGFEGVQARDYVRGRHRTHLRRIRAGMAGTTPGTRGRTQRPLHRARRHRIRTAGLLRQSHPHPEPGQAGRGWPALHEHAHHGAVLAHALVHPHRPQPPLQPYGRHHRDQHRLPRLRRLHPLRERLPAGDPPGPGLQHLRGRQVAPHARRPDPPRPAPTTAGRWAVASSATTASSAGTRTSTTPI